MILFLQLYRATTYNKTQICCLKIHATSEADYFFSFNFTTFFWFGFEGRVDISVQNASDMIFLLKSYDTEINQKGREYQI